jgi:hypothetical protein
MSNQLPKLV